MTSIRQRIKGSITALITPFKDGKVDEAAFRKLVNWQIAEGTQGLVPCGTTGESPTLSHEEHNRVIGLCVEEARGRVPVIAGAGSNSTEEAIMLTRHAKAVGCDAVLSVTGYYNKPTQEGQYRHFMAIADAVDIPIILYNIPGRAVVGITVAGTSTVLGEVMGFFIRSSKVETDSTAGLRRSSGLESNLTNAISPSDMAPATAAMRMTLRRLRAMKSSRRARPVKPTSSSSPGGLSSISKAGSKVMDSKKATIMPMPATFPNSATPV